MPAVTDKLAILDKLHQLPAMPEVVREVMSSFRDANVGSAILAHKIALDQGLSARILRVANSSFYGLAREVGSIQDAVTVLGFDAIRSLVVSAGFTRAFPATADDPFDRHTYWMRSFRVGTYTEVLAQCLGGVRQLSFTAGLFHDVGQLVLSVCIPEKFAGILAQQKTSGSSLIEVEQAVLGFDHAEIGAEMARRWNFPHEIENAIHFWRAPEHEPFEPIAGLVCVAVLIESGLSGNALINSVPKTLRDRLQLSWERIESSMPQPDQLDVVANLMLETQDNIDARMSREILTMEIQMNDQQAVPSSQTAVEVATILFVDDEANILSSLKRLFRPSGYRIFTAESGAQGLEIMQRETIDLVVSDMRMPEMNGAQFLEQVNAGWPETVRILLTGHAEIGATIDAINKGHIFRYISKPWEDNDIVLSIKQALHQKQLERANRGLEELTRKQNEELKDLNANLEQKVRARTEELRQAMGFLEVAHEKLKKGFITSIRIFSNLIEMREGAMSGHSHRVAELSRAIAQRMSVSDSEAQDIFLAALLHDVGKIGFPDYLLEKPFANLTNEERLEVIKHPVKGQTALMALEQLNGAAKLIRSHHEHYDGLGYPDKLHGLEIPLGARIIALANEYDAAQIGMLLSKRLKQADAVLFIQEGRGRRYDPTVVDAFMSVIGSKGSSCSGIGAAPGTG